MKMRESQPNMEHYLTSAGHITNAHYFTNFERPTADSAENYRKNRSFFADSQPEPHLPTKPEVCSKIGGGAARPKSRERQEVTGKVGHRQGVRENVLSKSGVAKAKPEENVAPAQGKSVKSCSEHRAKIGAEQKRVSQILLGSRTNGVKTDLLARMEQEHKHRVGTRNRGGAMRSAAKCGDL